MNEDWDLLVGFLPAGWEALATESGALKGLRKDKSPENLLRVLLLHLGSGHSLRETVVRARSADLADLTPAALMKRRAKAGPWLHRLCRALFAERGLATPGSAGGGFEVRLVDAVTVKETGRTGSLRRLHYSVRLPSLICDHFRVTATEGLGTGASFRQFPVAYGDYLIGGRGYATAAGLDHVARSSGHSMVRVNSGSLGLAGPDGRRFDLLESVGSLDRPGLARSWDVTTVGNCSTAPVSGRICAARKSETAIAIAEEALRRKAFGNGEAPRPHALEFAKYVIVFTTFTEKAGFTPEAVLDWFGASWQAEPVFKRFKSIAQLGHLPRRDGESSRAWLYGKLFAALLSEKLSAHAGAVSPLGYDFRSGHDRRQAD
ncbi:MAG: transposase [Rhodobacteraceae bacterium]|nr:transposase [Paracoccaceae bacterium]MCY4138358.1 transposase [Paracoccaceae bacterium]